MAFWGLEVSGGRTARVYPDPGTIIYIKQVSLGSFKKENIIEVINLMLKDIHGHARLVGQISPGGTIELELGLALDRAFELSHNWHGSVSFFGYSEQKPYDPEVDGIFPFSEEYIHGGNMGTEVVKADGSAGKPVGSEVAKVESDGSVLKPRYSAKRKVSGEAYPEQTKFRGVVRTALPISLSHSRAICDPASSNPTCPNKRPRLTDSLGLFLGENASMFAHFLILMQRGQIRVNELPSVVDSVRMSKSFGFLRMIGAKHEDLLEQIQLVLDVWKSSEDQLVRSAAKSDYLEPVPSPWVMMSDWHDLAYEELLSLRNEHSELLDLLYREKYEGFENKKICYPVLLSYKKCLNFMASSRYEISCLSKKKCVKRFMDIKRLVTVEKRMPSRIQHEHLPEDSASCNQTRVNWRDEIYEQIESSRMMHSLKLDEACRSLNDMPGWTVDVAEEVKVCREFLDSSLQFLACCRADLVSLSQEQCSEKLKKVQCFVDREKDSEAANNFWFLQTTLGYWTYPTQEEASVANWRDVAYAKLKTKADKFSLLVRDIYNDKIDEWSKEPESGSFLKQLDSLISVAWLGLYQMPRSRMARYLSADDYFAFVDRFVHGSYHISFLMKKLQAGDEPKWDPTYLIPKRFKLSS